MSIAAMNWVWQLQLPPNKKIVLLSLADSADDSGLCWPSIATISKKCTISTRTTQRALSDLVRLGLLISNKDFKKDGSRSSNKYRLLMNITPRQFDTTPHDTGDTTPRQQCHGGHVTGDVVNNNRTLIESSTSKTNGNILNSCKASLVYPKVSPSDLGKIMSVIEKLDSGIVHLSQELLDELQGGIDESAIKTTVVSYFKAMVNNAVNGRFKPYRGIAVAKKRKAFEKQAIEDAINTARTDPKKTEEYIAEMKKTLNMK